MTVLKRWLKKVIFGVAAFLLAGLQAMGNSYYLPYGYHYVPHGYGYMWTDSGLHVTLAQDQQPLARLEGEVHEDQIRTSLDSNTMDKAAS